MPCVDVFDSLYISKNHQSKQVNGLDFIRPSFHVIVWPCNTVECKNARASNRYAYLERKNENHAKKIFKMKKNENKK